jgi:predicted MFS family arabinose efflux permease
VPVAGALSLLSWRLAFVAVAVGSAIALVGVDREVHGERAPRRHGRAPREWGPMRRGIPLFASFALLSAASQMVVVVYGVWLEDEFGLTTAVIGVVGFLLGGGDLAANLASIRLTDRWGKVRSSIAGAALFVAAAVMLVFVSSRLVPGAIALVALLAGYEFALLSSKPLLTEIDPQQRGLAIGIGFGSAAVLRGAAALVGTAVYAHHGLGAAAQIAAVTALMAIALLQFAVPEPATVSRPRDARGSRPSQPDPTTVA